jgi:hypothetical protein
MPIESGARPSRTALPKRPTEPPRRLDTREQHVRARRGLRDRIRSGELFVGDPRMDVDDITMDVRREHDHATADRRERQDREVRDQQPERIAGVFVHLSR